MPKAAKARKAKASPPIAEPASPDPIPTACDPMPEILASAGAVERVEAPNAYEGRNDADALQGADLGNPELVSDAQELPADDLAGLLDRVAALEARLDALSVESAAPPTVGKARRSPAHERAVRRAWAERKARREAERCRDVLRADCHEWEALQHRTWIEAMGYKAKRRRAVLALLDARKRAALDKAALIAGDAFAKRLQAELEAARGEAEGARQAQAVMQATLSRLRADMADASQPERASDLARLVKERDEARTALSAVSARSDRQKQVLDQLAERYELMAVRVAKAEAALRKAGHPIAA